MASNLNTSGDQVVKAWLSAMQKAGKIKPGGQLVFINRHTGTAVSPTQRLPSVPNLEATGAGGNINVRTDPVAELRSKGQVLGKPKRGRR